MTSRNLKVVVPENTAESCGSEGIFSPEERDERKLNLEKIATMDDNQAQEELSKSAKGTKTDKAPIAQLFKDI